MTRPDRPRLWLGGAAALGFALLGVGAWFEPGRAAAAYLVAYAFGASLVLGCLFWVMIEHLAGAEWFVALRRTAEHGFAPLPLLLPLFVPILLALPLLYPWAIPGRIAQPALRAAVMRKLAYLNPLGFMLRTLLYFAIWLVCAALLRRGSLRQCATAAPGERLALVRRLWLVSAVGLPASAFALHFASVDWLMSLDPGWSSSIFGVYVFAGAALAALALLVVASVLLERGGRLAGVLGVSHYHALGKLMLTLLVFWAYVSFFQYFIVWIAGEPDELRWYLPRGERPWSWLALVLALGHFALPLVALLSRELKRRPVALAAVGGWLLALHYLDVYWMVIPSLGGARAAPHWTDVPAAVGVSALLLLCALLRGADKPEAARGDPRFERALRFETD